jgi:Matrixin
MRRLLPLMFALVLAAPAFGAALLTYSLPSGPGPVSWPKTAFPIRYSIDNRVASIVPNAQATVDAAFAAWQAVPDADMSFQDDGLGSAPAGHDGRNTISIADDLFKNQNYIALTTNWWSSDGQMTEADIQIDPSVAGGGYNMQQLLEHEIGHLLGLDHSAVLSSVMFPYVGSGPTAPLDSDERIAITSMYPKEDPTLSAATLQGSVGGDSGAIYAALVVAVDDRGQPVATALTDESGSWSMRGVPAGTYRIYAEPLDGPVQTKNLSGVYRGVDVKAFPTTFLPGPPLRVEAGKVYGNLLISAPGTARLNPVWIGLCASNGIDASLSSTAVNVRAGQQVSIAVAGDGFVSGMTKFEVLSPSFHRVSDFRYAGNYVTATFTIDGSAPTGSTVILVSNSPGEQATLTGALRIEGTQRMRVARR